MPTPCPYKPTPYRPDISKVILAAQDLLESPHITGDDFEMLHALYMMHIPLTPEICRRILILTKNTPQ